MELLLDGRGGHCVLTLENPKLRELASSLPEVLLRGKSLSMVKQYSGAFARWKRWANKNKEVCVFSASPFHVSLCLNYLIKKSNSSASVEQAVHALS